MGDTKHINTDIGMENEKLKRLYELIDIELDSCDKEDWPYICHMSADPATRIQIRDMIVEQIKQSGISVGTAIVRIEKAYNPNKIED
jgi:hypothetical protein